MDWAWLGDSSHLKELSHGVFSQLRLARGPADQHDLNWKSWSLFSRGFSFSSRPAQPRLVHLTAGWGCERQRQGSGHTSPSARSLLPHSVAQSKSQAQPRLERWGNQVHPHPRLIGGSSTAHLKERGCREEKRWPITVAIFVKNLPRVQYCAPFLFNLGICFAFTSHTIFVLIWEIS